jgi:hypothetical protein
VILGIAAALAIVVQDHAALRAAPQSSAVELAELGQGDALELRGEQAGYLKVYNYRLERGGYLRSEAVRKVGLSPADAPELLAVLRFLRDTPGVEALGVSYGAAYLRAAPAPGAEPLDAIAGMAERLADQASGTGERRNLIAAHLEVVAQFGIRMRSYELNGRIRMCYDGELFRRVLALPTASPEARARAALGLTRPDCIDPQLPPLQRAALDEERAQLLEGIHGAELTALTRNRLRVRRASVWAALAYEQARARRDPAPTAQRALAELAAVQPEELGEDARDEYQDALLRVSAIRWAALPATAAPGALKLSVSAGEPGQTCVEVAPARPASQALVRRCTYGIVWTGSAQSIAQGRALVVAVQPLESWRELWVFHDTGGTWNLDVLSPGVDEPEAGFIEFAGFAPGTERLLIAREVRERGRYLRRFEELRLKDLALVRQASTPELLRDFGRWQDPDWRRETLVLH